MSGSGASLNDRIAALLARYWPRVHAQLDELCAAVSSRDPALIEDIYRLTHTLHGTAGTYGLAELSSTAAVAESIARDVLQTPDALDEATWSRLDAAVASLKTIAEQSNPMHAHTTKDDTP